VEGTVVAQLPSNLKLHDIAPDGRVLFTKEDSRARIYFVGPGSPTPVDLTWLNWAIYPVLSADGKTLLMTENDEATQGKDMIYLRGTDGSPAIRLGENVGVSMSPDGHRFVYRTFGPDGEGLRIMDIETKRVTLIASGYDNFPLWSPRGDLIMFSRQVEGDYEIYTIKPDGTGLNRLTHSPGNDAHMAWAPDGEHIVFASTRMGFKDEVPYTDAPQPYGEIFVMRADGSEVQQLTDNQWEEGTPAWQPTKNEATR